MFCCQILKLPHTDALQAKLKTNGVPGLCAITSEVEGARTLHFITVSASAVYDPRAPLDTQYCLQVITSLGGVHQYKFDPRIGGECKLDRVRCSRHGISVLPSLRIVVCLLSRSSLFVRT